MPNQGFGSFLIEERKVRPTSPLLRDLVPTAMADVPVHMRLPRNQDATNQLDSVMLDFMTERRKAAAQGTPSSSLVGPAYPSISSLLNPARAPKQTLYRCSGKPSRNRSNPRAGCLLVYHVLGNALAHRPYSGEL